MANPPAPSFDREYAAFVVELKARIQMARDLPVSDTPYAAVVRNSAVIEILGLAMGRLH